LGNYILKNTPILKLSFVKEVEIMIFSVIEMIINNFFKTVIFSKGLVRKKLKEDLAVQLLLNLDVLTLLIRLKKNQYRQNKNLD